MRPILFAVAPLLLMLARPAHAESYALLDLNSQIPCMSFSINGCTYPDPVTSPQASLTGGAVRVEVTYHDYGVQGEEEYANGQPIGGGNRVILITPASDFPVSGIRFNLTTAPSPASDIDIYAADSTHITKASATYPCDLYVCNYVVDLEFPFDASAIEVVDEGDDYAWAFSIDTIELNPLLAPTAVTPEPSSLFLAGTGVSLLLLAAFRKARVRPA